MNKTFPHLVGLFGNTSKTVGFKVHSAGCSVVNTAGRKVSKCEVSGFMLVDMAEREFKVTYCKCVAKADVVECKAAAVEHGPTGQY